MSNIKRIANVTLVNEDKKNADDQVAENAAALKEFNDAMKILDDAVAATTQANNKVTSATFILVLHFL